MRTGGSWNWEAEPASPASRAPPEASGDRLKGPTTHTKGDVPEDFREAFAAYVAQDDQLYAEALELLDAHVEAFPRCKS